MELNSEEAGRMVRLLQHRLLNIASGIKSANSLLSSTLDERLTVREREFFPLIHQECDQICNIAGRLSALFGAVPKSIPTPLKNAVSISVADLRNTFPMADLLLEMKASDPSRYICMATLNTVLREAVGNACEISKSPVTILIEDVEDGCSICIIDHGEALLEEVQKMAFESFYSTRTRHLGVGLTLAKRLVEEQGGAVSIGTEPTGNVVKFVIPFMKI